MIDKHMMSRAKMSRFFFIISSQADIDKNTKVKSILLFVSLSFSVILPVAQNLIYYRRDRCVSIFEVELVPSLRNFNVPLQRRGAPRHRSTRSWKQYRRACTHVRSSYSSVLIS